MNKENQARIIELVKQAKPLILQEMVHEKVTEKGAADYVTNVDVAVQNYLKKCSYVKSYRNGEHGEGGAGATVVEFK